MPDERRSGDGRRQQDQALDVIVGRLRDAEGRFERELDKLELELDRLRDAIDRRIRELEEFHIEDRARARAQITERLRSAQRIGAIASVSAVITGALAILEHFAHV